jgi:hypothetical protein
MLKKNSWIVALLVALSITAFFIVTGCVPALVVEEDNEVYEEYPLDKGYNAWAGQVYQKGWATGGIKFQGKGDAIVIAKDLGYDIEMFQKATKLKIEMPDASYPRSGVDIIWGGEDENGDSGKAGGMWNQQPIAGGSGDIDTTFAKKDGNVLIIDLQKALKNYSAYTKAAKLKIVMQVNAPSYGDVEGLVQKAFLMIPATPPPFVNVDTIGDLDPKTMYWTNEMVLSAKVNGVKGKDATNQQISWAIKSFRPPPVGGVPSPLIALPNLDLYDPASVAAYETKLTALKAIVWWAQEEYIIDDSVTPVYKGLRDVVGTIAAPGETLAVGTVTLVATIKNAIEDKDGKPSDLSKEKTFTITNPLKLNYKLGSTDTSTVRYQIMDNFGISGSKMALVNGTEATGYTGFTIHFEKAYGNSYYYIEVDFGGENILAYKGIKFKYTGVGAATGEDGGNDYNNKNIRIKASHIKPKAGKYNLPDYYLAIDEENTGNVDGTVADIDIPFFTYPASAAESLRKEIDATKVNDSFTTAKKVYFCFTPWGTSMDFKITDIEIYK